MRKAAISVCAILFLGCGSRSSLDDPTFIYELQEASAPTEGGAASETADATVPEAGGDGASEAADAPIDGPADGSPTTRLFGELPDGEAVIVLPDGGMVEVAADGGLVATLLDDGGIEELPDGAVIDVADGGQVLEGMPDSALPEDSGIVALPDGAVVQVLPDGGLEALPDGGVLEVLPDGGTIRVLPDGGVVSILPDGGVAETPDAQSGPADAGTAVEAGGPGTVTCGATTCNTSIDECCVHFTGAGRRRPARRSGRALAACRSRARAAQAATHPTSAAFTSVEGRRRRARPLAAEAVSVAG
jgi:hypothetical protein